MTFRALVGILIVIICCSCTRKTSIGEVAMDSGLLIEIDSNRGVGYTDSLGARYNLRYIPITITNDSTIAIHIQIAFSSEYNYPTAYGGQKFNVFAFPKELKPDDVVWDTISYDLVKSKLRDFFDRGFETPYILNETLQPGEIFVMSIGTLYPRPPKVCGVLPNALFAHSDRGNFPECDWFMKEDLSSIPKAIATQIALGLKLNFRENCMIIPCGQISYPKD